MTLSPTQKRAEMAHIMDLLVENASNVHYGQHRPMRSASIISVAQLLGKVATNPGITMDCSETVTLICRLSHLRDPNGMEYDGYGNSHEMWRHLRHYSNPSEAFVGGIVVFGPEGDDHVAMVRHPGTDPMLFSHGGEPGPNLIRYSWLAKALRPPAQMLSIAALL
jgi:hypothetical protein